MKNTLKQWLSQFYPDVLIEWEYWSKEEKKRYKREYAKSHYLKADH